jgi:hypothetical protein
MALSHKPRQKPDFRLEEIDGELLLYHPTQTTIMYCNPSASVIWQLCDGERTVEEITILLAAAFAQNLETITADVESTLDLFCKHKAIDMLDEQGRVVRLPGSG